MARTWEAEEIRRDGAYHEAAHAVADVALGHTVRYVSIETKGTNLRDICVTAVNHMEFGGMGLIPVPWEALGYAISAIAGNMAMFRVNGIRYPWDSWQEITRECEDVEALDDPDELQNDTMMIREYCEAAALWGQTASTPAYDELPEGAPPLPQTPSTTREAYEIALREAESLVEAYWGVIATVAERLIEKGYLTGDEVEAIVFDSEPSPDNRRPEERREP